MPRGAARRAASCSLLRAPGYEGARARNVGSIVGAALADIFLGKISKWNDPAIKKLNPSVNLPDQAIITVHRSDGSGTTFIFVNYLSKVSKEWDSRVGAATAVDWPVGIGAKGNEFIASNVAGTRGAIGYVEFAYAKQNKLTYTRMINKDGKTVSLSIPTMQAAAAGAKRARTNRRYGAIFCG